MSLALSQGKEKDPLDHSIEAALPGVHLRLVAVCDKIVAMQTDLSDFREEQKKKLDKIDATTKEQTLALAGMLRALSNSLEGNVTGRRVEGDGSDDSVPALEGTSEPSPVDPEKEKLLEECVRYHVYQGHKNLRSARNEWLGEGEWKDRPIPGGVRVAEEQFKSRWRCGYSSAERKYFS